MARLADVSPQATATILRSGGDNRIVLSAGAKRGAHDRLEELTDGGMGVITLGSAGSVARIDGELMRVPAQRCEAVDTTGAGDTYLGVFAAARAAGELIFECMVQASFASGLAVTRLGAQPSIPTWDEVVAWMMGW